MNWFVKGHMENFCLNIRLLFWAMEFLEKLIFRFTDLYYTKRTYGIGMINFQFNIYKKST